MHANIAEKLQHVMAQIHEFVPVMRSVMGFKLKSDNDKEPLPLEIKKSALASAIEAGVDHITLKVAQDFLTSARKILSSFIYFSVNEKKVGEGDGAYKRPGKFTGTINTFQEQCFHQDIIDGLVAKMNVLMEAVRIENGEDFTKRIEAYNALYLAIEEAKAEQERRDVARSSVDRRYPGKRKHRHQPAEEAVTVSTEAQSIADKRQQMLEARKSAAHAVQSLF